MRKSLWLLILMVTACGAQSAPEAPTATAPPTATVRAPASPTPSAGATVLPTQAASQPTAQATGRPTPVASALVESTTPNGDRVLGRTDAPITITDYSDFL
ncbi:MAG: hypothetical protein HY259_13575 [Chloroflexi bacterium]|nr:hypothetical protein [Chloroflexota bacterium]MBI3734465.1 hypothetical protein [Chloroflexota bacterium]